MAIVKLLLHDKFSNNLFNKKKIIQKQTLRKLKVPLWIAATFRLCLKQIGMAVKVGVSQDRQLTWKSHLSTLSIEVAGGRVGRGGEGGGELNIPRRGFILLQISISSFQPGLAQPTVSGTKQSTFVSRGFSILICCIGTVLAFCSRRKKNCENVQISFTEYLSIILKKKRVSTSMSEVSVE